MTAAPGARPALPNEELEGGLEASLTTRAPWTRCAEYAGLLVLAGRGEFVPVQGVCEAAASDRSEDARAGLGACPPRWREALVDRLSVRAAR